MDETVKPNATTDETVEELDVTDVLETLMAAQVHQKRYSEALAEKVAAQDVTIAELVKLVHSQQNIIERAAIKAMPKGTVH